LQNHFFNSLLGRVPVKGIPEAVLSREPKNQEERVVRDRPSRSYYRGVPLISGLGSEGPQGAAGDEMALQVEGVVDGGMGGEEALSGSR